jgi:hypothetical protein
VDDWRGVKVTVTTRGMGADGLAEEDGLRDGEMLIERLELGLEDADALSLSLGLREAEGERLGDSLKLGERDGETLVLGEGEAD